MDRFDLIRPWIEGKDCLDIGCVAHSVDQMRTMKQLDAWLHGRLKTVARNLVGIDTSQEGINEMKRRGYNVLLMDGEKISLEQQFDVIVAGELIEHLSNPGLLLDGCKKCLKTSGHLILTTPNVYGLTQVIRFFKWGNTPRNVNREHTHWYCPVTMKQLLKRHGFKIERILYPDDGFLFHKILGRLGLSNLRTTMIVIARKKTKK
jgi:2-polyprenyl-3-methyl-5-hydroxy-6-metoxy-1,4-benzoquinol methylase